ncbi:flagellar hook-length control protein FliK [Desulfobacter sp.]|uniref:flagellar hook-length control protein FliK n=1 Tax=Desulfobacter sp. TaxID=2294 RepID=UPI003D148B52
MIPGQSFTSLKIIGGNQAQSGLSDDINLKPGRIIDAKVLDVKPENRVQLLLSEKNESGNPLLDGQKVEVSTQLPLKPGMSLTLTVVATREGPVLKLVSSTALSFPGTDAALKILPGTQKSSTLPESGIKPGQTVEAKVLDVTPQNRVQLLVGGQKLTVSTQLPLARGMEIPMKVVRSQDGIVLKPVSALSAPVSTSPAGAGIDSTRGPAVTAGRQMSPAALPDVNPFPGTENAFQSLSLAKIFQGLSALSQTREPILNAILMGLSLKSDVRDDQFLPQIIENMGLSFEKKLAAGLENASDKKAVTHVIKQLAGQDLKAASLSLSSAESDPGKASVFKHIADALNNFAQLNVKSGDSGQNQDGTRFLLPFPVWRENGFDFGQLMVDMGKAGTANTEKKMLSISFLLNMTALGPLRADFSILDKTIAGRFLLENQATCDYLTPKISNLRQRLSRIGYQAGNIDCQVARPEQIAPASLMLSMKASDNMQGLNIVV